MNASGEWDINGAYLSLCRVSMTRQSDIVFQVYCFPIKVTLFSKCIVFRLKKPVKFVSALHRDSVPLIGQSPFVDKF